MSALKKPYPPFGMILQQFMTHAFPLSYSPYVFVGRKAIYEASRLVSFGQAHLALPPGKEINDYEWPIKGLSLILFATEDMENVALEKMAYQLLGKGAKQICIFYGDNRPVEIFNHAAPPESHLHLLKE